MLRATNAISALIEFLHVCKMEEWKESAHLCKHATWKLKDLEILIFGDLFCPYICSFSPLVAKKIELDAALYLSTL